MTLQEIADNILEWFDEGWKSYDIEESDGFRELVKLAQNESAAIDLPYGSYWSYDDSRELVYQVGPDAKRTISIEVEPGNGTDVFWDLETHKAFVTYILPDNWEIVITEGENRPETKKLLDLEQRLSILEYRMDRLERRVDEEEHRLYKEYGDRRKLKLL